MEHSNVYPRITPSAIESLDSILNPSDADKQNNSVAAGSFPSDLDKEVFDTAQEQSARGLLSKPMTEKEIDRIFGKGNWRAIRRQGLRQHDKVRGIDNARSFKTNCAAFLQDTIMTTPHDIAIQEPSWLFSGSDGAPRYAKCKHLKVSLGADDLADAYHGLPNAPSQRGLCVVGIMNPELKIMDFYISYAHLFGLSAAVVHFNRLPEHLTAACRRIGCAVGCATTLHFRDGLNGMHNLLLNIKERYSRVASMGEIMQLTGVLVFLLMSCFDKIGKGGLRPFDHWISKHADMTSLWITQNYWCPVVPNLLVGKEFFIHAIPLLKPNVYCLGVVHTKPIIAYSDAEWTPAALPPSSLGEDWVFA